MIKKNGLILLFAAIKFVLPFLVQHHDYDLHRDEFLYLAEGRHLAWGYMEVPPFLSVLAWITNGLGGSFFWVKFWPALFGSLTFVVAAKIVQSLGGRAFALLLLFLAFISGAYIRLFFLFQPNFPEVFFYTVIAWGIVRYIQTGKNNWLYVTGIAAGLGLLSKYSVLFFIIALIPAILLTPRRRMFANKHLYFAALCGLLLFLPNIIWQYQHNFPVLFHMRELQETQLKFNSSGSFLVNQLLMNLATVFVWVSGLYALFFVKRYRPYLFFGVAYFILLALLIWFQGKAYYALGIYPVLFAVGAVHLENLTFNKFIAWRIAMVALPLVMLYRLMPLMLPPMAPQPMAEYYADRGVARYGALKWEDLQDHSLPQDFADMLGWQQMAEKVSKLYHSLPPAEQKNTLIYAGNYGEAGALNHYRKQFRLPETYSANATFLWWMKDVSDVKTVILITDDPTAMNHPLIKQFGKINIADSITTLHARERGSLIALLQKPATGIMKAWQEKIQKDKEQFTRDKPE